MGLNLETLIGILVILILLILADGLVDGLLHVALHLRVGPVLRREELEHIHERLPEDVAEESHGWL